MKFYGDLDFNNNQAQNLSVELESEFPATPVKGRVVFRNKRVWICTDAGGIPVWVPLGPLHDTHVHIQVAPSALWEIEHNFNSNSDLITPIYPIIQIYDGTSNQVIPQAIYYVNDAQVNVELPTVMAGKAVVMYGGAESSINLITPTYAYEYTQPTESSTWVIRHWLGYNPIVRIFDNDGNEIQPETITVDDSFQVTIWFSTPVVGTAKLV